VSAPWQRWLWIGVAVALHLAAAGRGGWRNSPAPAVAFVIPTPAPGASLNAPVHREELVDPHFVAPSVHVSSLCELPGGGLAAAWYGGTREGARDVAIYLATCEPGADTWSAPQPLVTRESAARETFRYVKKVGNPLLFAGTNGQVCLLYVSIAVGGWSGSSLNLKQSFDSGRTWSWSRRLGLSPCFNVSELVKNGPTRLADGGWVVPIYHELLGKFPELLWLHADAAGVTAVKSRPFGGQTAFQPALVALDAEQALLLCRTAGSLRETYLARTDTTARHWTPPQPTGLPNPDSGLDALRLSDGRLLLAFNDTPAGREVLRLAWSTDDGRNWTRAATLADDPGAEFSYPFLLQTRDGLVHVSYTWKRRGIKHVTFNLAWLDAQARSDPR
jgi:predicted neuraminidase